MLARAPSVTLAWLTAELSATRNHSRSVFSPFPAQAQPPALSHSLGQAPPAALASSHLAGCSQSSPSWLIPAEVWPPAFLAPASLIT